MLVKLTVGCCCCCYYCYYIRLPFCNIFHFFPQLFPCESTTNLLVWTHKLFFHPSLAFYLFSSLSLSPKNTHTPLFYIELNSPFPLTVKKRRPAKLILVVIQLSRQFGTPGFTISRKTSNKFFILIIDFNDVFCLEEIPMYFYNKPHNA